MGVVQSQDYSPYSQDAKVYRINRESPCTFEDAEVFARCGRRPPVVGPEQAKRIIHHTNGLVFNEQLWKRWFPVRLLTFNANDSEYLLLDVSTKEPNALYVVSMSPLGVSKWGDGTDE